MISQTIVNHMRRLKLEQFRATQSQRASLRDMVRRYRLYAIAAESSYILRWLGLVAVSLVIRLLPWPRERHERFVIELGNKTFHPMIARDVYKNFDSYVSLMGSGLDQFSTLYPQRCWLLGRDILDLGSGLGQYSQELVKGGALSVTGLEYQRSKACWSTARWVSPRLQFITGTADAMPFDAESFDAVFSHTVFEHIANVEAALREVRRVLRPEGVALISYNFLHHRGGHHLFPYIHFPWATWLVSEAALCEYWSQHLAEDQAVGTMGFYEPGTRIRSLSEGAEIHLNRLTFEDFERLVERAGLRIVKRRSSEELARTFPWLVRLPRLRYFLAGTFYYVLTPHGSSTTCLGDHRCDTSVNQNVECALAPFVHGGLQPNLVRVEVNLVSQDASTMAAINCSTTEQPTPRVSVLLTVYNDRPEYVHKAIDSILSQSLTDFELVIVTDGTTRGETIELIDRFVESDARVHLFRQPHRGLTETLNIGLTFCRAPLICRQDADDSSHPERLAKQCDFMDKHLEVAVVGSAVELCQAAGQRLWIQSLPCEPAAILKSFPTANPFCHGAICFRASAARAIGGFNPLFRCAQDYDFLWRMCERFAGANLPDTLYRHRRTPGSMVSQMNVLLARERLMARLLARQRTLGEAEDACLVSETALRRIVGGTAQFRLGMADQQLLAGHYLASLISYVLAIAGAPHHLTAYLKAIRWLLFVLAPRYRARLFGQ